MSLKLTGDKSRVVHHLQERLDKFEQASKSFERSNEQLNACAAEKVELTQVPAHEAHYQTLLSEYKKAAATLKGAADSVQKKQMHTMFINIVGVDTAFGREIEKQFIIFITTLKNP